MAQQTDDSHSAELVGNTFLQQYYRVLHESPEDVHKFYSESSVLSRPDADGVMTSVTTMQGINEKIVSLDFQNYYTQILTADAQFSYKDGVIVLVTGCITGNNKVKRKFTQSFFLAPQDNGYFVLNDVFRYIDDETSNDADGSSQAPPFTPSIESTVVTDESIPIQTIPLELDSNNGNEVSQVLDNGKEPVAEEGSVVEEQGLTDKEVAAENPADSTHNVTPPVPEAAVPVAAVPLREDAPKKSFASVVNALNKNTAPFHVRAAPTKPVIQPRATAVPEAPAPVSNNVVENNNDPAVKAHAIFVANLPMSATVEELEKVFKEFGPIKHDGIQVRSNKQQGTCFGFVEFESASSMQKALEASPIVFANRKLSIEERRANNERGRFSSGRSGYRNDNFRGRGNYNGGRGYGRNEFEKRGGEFSGRARVNNGPNANAEAYQRSYPNGGGKVARQTVKVA
ncbi:nuclear transport factor 2 isoform X1 [Ziziphus jujuba]|uniref:Nuclear transport factor 2 isoform X1 n=1 Tax=Ziziphus jujuba TaxID=326968 RepID=A0ABM3I1X9_ZIZJJ|nr:nuclear transport factor 2 isoform X1 [Ziziphus jujuba]